MTYEKESRDRLIDCAKKEFLEKGFTKASLRSISSAAGLTTGAIYFFFKDKDGLFSAVVKPTVDRITSIIYEHYAAENDEDFSTYVHSEGDHDDISEKLVPALYDDLDAVQILLGRSAGSSYEHFVDNIISMTEQFYLRLAEKYAAVCPGKRVNMYMLHWFCHVQINAFTHLIAHVPDEQTALREIKPVMDMLIDAWMKYILEDDI